MASKKSAGKRTRQHREYKFVIDAFTPNTIPMARLAQYLTDLAKMIGQDQSVHLARIEEGSTVPVVLVEWEAEVRVKDRLRAVKRREAPQEALDAARAIDQRLAEDNAKADLVDPTGSKLLKFPGREGLTRLQFGPMNQPGTLQGIPIKVGGEGDPVPVHLEDGEDKFIVHAKRNIARDIAQYLFTTVVRVEGTGRWLRHRDGEWEMVSFNVATFKPLKDAGLRESIDELRKIQSGWKQLEDPLEELRHIRKGDKLQ